MERLFDVLAEGNEGEAIRLLAEHFALVERLRAAQESERVDHDEHSIPAVPPEHGLLMDASATGHGGRLMLYLAAGGGHKEVVAFLLSKGAQVDFTDEKGTTAVMHACQEGHVGVVQMLLGHMGEQGLEETNTRGMTALHYAAGKGHEEVARLLLSKGAQAAPRDRDGMTPVMVASILGKLAVVRLLVQHIGEQGLVEENEDGRTALHLAAQSGYEDVVGFLLSKGAQASSRSKGGLTPLLDACRKGHLAVMRLLLQHTGAEGLVEADEDGRTALHFAAGVGHEELVGVLLGEGAQAGARDKAGMTPFILASREGHAAVLQVLLEHRGGQGLDDMTDRGSTALYLAAAAGHKEVVAFLLSKGAQTGIRDVEGLTPFMTASARGNLDVVRVFVEHMGGRVLEEVNEKGITALYFAALLGHEEVVAFLISKGAQTGSNDKAGNSPLMVACHAGRVGVVRFLLPHTGEEALQEMNRKGQTALHHAASAGHEEMVTFLLSEGAEANSTDEDGRTPFMLASLGGHLGVVRVLGEAMGGGRVNAEDEEGSTALHLAASEGHAEVVSFLLSMGAVIDTVDVDTRTPLMSASVNGHVGVVRVLMEVMGKDELEETDGDEITALHLAADQGHEEVVRVLLDKGAQTSCTDDEGRTPLMDGVSGGHLGVVKVLVQHREGRGLEEVEDRGFTVLHLAAESGHVEVLRFLLVAGADLTLTDHHGRTPRALAEAKGRDKCVAVIDWWQSELERRRVLSRAVCLHKASMTQRDMPTSRVPAYLEARVAAGHEPPIVEVVFPPSKVHQDGETEASASGKKKAGDAAGDAQGDEVGEEERHATLELVLQGLNEELLTELLEGFYSEG